MTSLRAACLLAVAAATLLPGLAAVAGRSEPAANATVMTLQAVGVGKFHHIAVADLRDPKHIYYVDSSKHTVGRFTLSTDKLEVLAGIEGQPGYRDGPGKQALFARPAGLCCMPHGYLAVADAGNFCIRQVNTDTGDVSTLAGQCADKPGFADGSAEAALFGTGLKSIVCLADCSVLVADQGNGRLRLIQLQDGDCVGAIEPGTRIITRESIKWLLAGVVLLSILALGGKKYLQHRAADVGEGIEQLRAQQSGEGEAADQGLPARQKHQSAARRFHRRFSGRPEVWPPGRRGDESPLLMPQEEPPSPPLLDLESAGEAPEGRAAGDPPEEQAGPLMATPADILASLDAAPAVPEPVTPPPHATGISLPTHSEPAAGTSLHEHEGHAPATRLPSAGTLTGVRNSKQFDELSPLPNGGIPR